jgi:hypothetical protein
MSHLQLCGTFLRQMKTGVSINHQLIELGLLSQCGSLCMEQYAGIHAISSKIMLSDFHMLQIARATTWTGQHGYTEQCG